MSSKKEATVTDLRSPNAQVVLALILFAISAFFASSGDLGLLETKIFHIIYDLPIWLVPLFLTITQIGNITLFFIVAALYLMKRNFHMGLRILMSGTLAYLLAGVAKDLMGRPRPTELLLDVISRELYVRGPGFPSGHTALATAVMLVIGYHLPKKHRWIVPVVILLVAVSRVYLGVHAPLDIVGGYAIGWGAYAIFRNVRISDIHKRYKKSQKSLKKPKNKNKL